MSIPATAATTRQPGERPHLPVGQPTHHHAGGSIALAGTMFARRAPESWRLVGRPYDPRQRALSRGEQRVQAVDRIVYGSSGVLAGLMVLYVIAAAVWR